MKLILGTMTFSDQVNESDTSKILKSFAGAGRTELDTAHMYNKGDTERLLGQLLEKDPDLDFDIATKVNPWNDQGLSPDQVALQFAQSLDRMGVDSVDMLYLHSPDLDTPIERTLEACQKLYEENRFRRLGLSNYASWQVAEIVGITRANGWVEPSVYQGMYNALTRDVERELFPCLRNFEIAFYAYNPLAGGMLTGKHARFSDDPQSGRFAGYDSYPERYWKRDYFKAVKRFTESCAAESVPPAQAALRWLAYHSSMSEESGDGIIVGASSIDQFHQNLSALDGGELPDEIVNALNIGWETVRPHCIKYFRP